MELDKGKKSAERAAKWYERRSNDRVVGIVEGLLEMAEELGFSTSSIDALNSFIELSNETEASISKLRPTEKQDQPFVWKAGQLVHGPYGQGIYIPSDDTRFSPCPVCGVDIRNGIRCAWCGNIDD